MSGKITQSLKQLLPKPSQLPPILRPTTGSLYEVISRTPSGGVGTKVHQTRWSLKRIPDCYWVVTRSRFKQGGKHGKAWGRLYWRGALVSQKEEKIRGDLKYTWKEGPSWPSGIPDLSPKPNAS